MKIIIAALLFAMVFYSGTAIVRMVKAIQKTQFISLIDSKYSIGWFAILIILNIFILASIFIYYNHKTKTNVGEPGPPGYEGDPGMTG